jgi:two-component system, NarL family, sensor kinase
MREGVSLAPGGVDDQREHAGGHGSAARPVGSAEIEAMRRRLVRLAFDVHDGPMQDLIGIAWRLQSARERAVAAAEAGELASFAAVFDDVAGDLGGVEKGLRSLMFSLEDGARTGVSLRVPVDAHVEAFKKRASACVEVTLSGDVEPRTDSQRIALERVLRESLSNIAKHAHAEHVAITLRGTDESIVLQVRDDGCGFVPHARATGVRHVGIRAMRERLRLLGGEFTIDSRPGGPTIVTARIAKWQASQDMESAMGGFRG